MRSDRPVVDYEGADLVQPPAQEGRPWLMKSAGEVGTRVCVVGFGALAAAMILLRFTWTPSLTWIMFIVAGGTCVIGGIVSVIGMFEPPDVRSHVAAGCLTSLLLGLAFVACVMFGLSSWRR